MSTPTVFDPLKFKAATRAQWENAAEPWHRWGLFLGEWLGPATERMLDLVGIQTGNRVLDVAAGAGEQTLRAAHRVGPAGYVLATDISPAILEHAAAAAHETGLSQIETLELDGEKLAELPGETFDAVISRVGLIYFPDQQKALAGMKHVLKPGGRIGAIVYSTPQNNAFFATPVAIIRRRANLPPPLPGQPGPFSLGADGVLAAALERAGLRDVIVEKVDAPVRLPSAAECVRFERESFGALHQMMVSLSDAERADAWEEIESELKKFEGPGGFAGPCEVLVATGVK